MTTERPPKGPLDSNKAAAVARWLAGGNPADRTPGDKRRVEPLTQGEPLAQDVQPLTQGEPLTQDVQPLTQKDDPGPVAKVQNVHRRRPVRDPDGKSTAGGGQLPERGGALHEHATERAGLVAWLRKLANADDDRTFKSSEQAEIRREIEALHVEARTLTELNRQQQKAIEQLLAEVQHSSERMGRKDWVTYTIGAATSLVIMEIVPPLALLHLATHALHALGHLFILDAY